MNLSTDSLPLYQSPLTRRCEHCGGPLEVFEEEAYCPDCLGFDVASMEDER